MNPHANTFGSPSGEPSTTTTRPMHQQMCEKLWTYAREASLQIVQDTNVLIPELCNITDYRCEIFVWQPTGSWLVMRQAPQPNVVFFLLHLPAPLLRMPRKPPLETAAFRGALVLLSSRFGLPSVVIRRP